MPVASSSLPLAWNRRLVRRRNRWAAGVLGVVAAVLLLTPSLHTPLMAQGVPVIETLVPLDADGRITVLTPTLVSRLGLTSPNWPETGGFREARLYRTDTGAHVLVVQRMDGTVARFALAADAVFALQRAIGTGLLAQGRGGDRLLGAGTGYEVSQPAGNAFVRNQTLLGLVAYGPATAALLSNSSGAAAAGGYFLAAGTSFFVAANIVKNRTVTRAQASRAAHGGTRGALTGVAVAAIVNADGGPAWGGPILAGAIGGTMAGYLQARGLSDGEAAGSRLFADLGALTTLGVAGTLGVFTGREYEEPFEPGFPERGTYTRSDNSLRGPGKTAVGVAIGSSIVGYALGPRYARRAAYNVTAGDVSMVYSGALLGGLALSSLPSEKSEDAWKYSAATAGMLAGALLADRGFVRGADRTSADGTLAQLGALAGALMGAGLATIAETEARGALALGALGGALGLLAADGIIKPAGDAGPLRGVMRSSARAMDGRVFVSVGPVSSVRITF